MNNNDDTIADCHIPNEARLHLFNAALGPFTVHIQPPEEAPRFSLDVDSSDTIESVKDRIAKKEQIPPRNIIRR